MDGHFSNLQEETTLKLKGITMFKLTKRTLVLFLAVAMLMTPLGGTVAFAVGEYTGYSEFNYSGYNTYNLRVSGPTNEIVYCYDRTLEYPGHEVNPHDDHTSGYTRESYGEQSYEIQKQIRKVLWHGYPMNKVGLQEKYGLSNDQFQAITQIMVWNYTEGEVIFEDGVSEYLKQLAHSVLDDVIKSEVDPPKNMDLNFYLSPYPEDEGHPQTEKNVQNLIGAHFVVTTPDPEPEPETTDVTFSKTSVIGTDELVGAELKVTLHPGGEVVESWTSEKEAKVITLKRGAEYTMTETTVLKATRLLRALSSVLLMKEPLRSKKVTNGWLKIKQLSI